MELPLIDETEYLILGGSTEALKEAFYLAGKGRKVTMVTNYTFLATDLCGTNRYFEREQLNWLPKMPESLFQGNGIFHPDCLKRYLEHLCEQNGIRLFYFLWKTEICKYKDKQLVKLAGKGGLFGILCQEVKEFSWKEKDVVCETFVREGGSQYWSVLGAQRQTKKEQNVAVNLFHCRQAILNKYIEQKKEQPDWHMGRFAVRGHETKDGCKSLEENQKMVRKCQKKVPFRVGNEILLFQKYPVLVEDDSMFMEIREYDLVVAGGGTAGVMAAIHGARNGLKTVVIEPNYELGGTGTVGGVTSYWFGRRFRDVMEIDEEVRKVSEKCGLKPQSGIWSEFEDFHAGIKAQVYLQKCLEAGVDVVFGQIAFGAVMENEELAGVVTAGEEGNVAYLGKVTLDATGDGDIAVAAGADYEMGSGRDYISYWASLAQYVSGDAYKNNFSYMLMCADPEDYTRFILDGRKQGGKTFDHGTYVSMRESRHIKGKYRMTLRDLLTFRKYADGLYTCFSNYDPKGKVTADLIYAGVLPPQSAIQIPLSALEPVDRRGKGIRGLYILGKAISASHDIFPSIRMQPDLMHQGAVMGELCAIALRKGVLPEDFSGMEIQKTVAETTGDYLEMPDWSELPCTMAERIDNSTRSNWIDVPFIYEEKIQNPLITAMCADAEDVLPILRKRLQTETDDGLRRRLIGCALWHGEDRWTEEFCEMLCKELISKPGILPSREGAVNCVQLLPDHGAMPEFVYNLNLLAWSKKKCILAPFYLILKRLETGRRDYEDIRKGVFHYVEAFAYVAERTGRKEFCAMLKKLMSFWEFRVVFESGIERNLMTERMSVLALSLCRALARLGEKEGYVGLIALLKSRSTAISCSACQELQQLTKAQHGFCQERWKREIEDNVRVKKVQKIHEKIW